MNLSTDALVQRINRKLAAEGEQLRAAPARDRSNLGSFYAVDTHRNAVTATHVDPEQWGRELGVIAPHERVAD